MKFLSITISKKLTGHNQYQVNTRVELYEPKRSSR